MRKIFLTALLAIFSLNANALSILLTGGNEDRDVTDRLTGLGHTVTDSNAVWWDSNFDYSVYDVVAFQYGAGNPYDIANLVTAVQNQDVGVVFFRGWDAGATMSALGLGAGAGDWQYAQNNLDIVNNNHYITQGTSLGINDLGYTYMSYEAAPGANTTVLANGADGAALVTHNTLRVALTPFYAHPDGYGDETALGIQLTENTLQWAAGAGSLTVVPVPAAVWLFGSALAGLGWCRRRQSA